MKSKKYAMGDMIEGEDSPMAPKTSMRPKPRPAAMDMSEEDRAALERMGRSMQREGEEAKDMGLKKGGKVKKMKSGGKVRGYGMARGGKACKMS